MHSCMVQFIQKFNDYFVKFEVVEDTKSWNLWKIYDKLSKSNLVCHLTLFAWSLLVEMHGDTFRLPIWEYWTKKWYRQIGDLKKFAKTDTFRSAIWTLQGMLSWRHVSVAIWALIGVRTAADTGRHGSWLTDDLNPCSISQVTCSLPILRTWISWLQYITNVTPLILLFIYHHVTLSNTLTITPVSYTHLTLPTILRV